MTSSAEQLVPLRISGNPSEEEIVAITAAYQAFLAQLAQSASQTPAVVGALWAYISRSHNRVSPDRSVDWVTNHRMLARS